MNKYVNQSERAQLVRLGGVLTAIEDTVQTYSKLKNTDKAMLKSLRTAATFTLKALKTRMSHLDPASQVKLAGDTKRYVIVVKDKEAYVAEKKQIDKENENYPVNHCDLLDLIEITIGSTCQLCDGTLAPDCRLKDIFLKYDIPALEENAENGKCPYQYRLTAPVPTMDSITGGTAGDIFRAAIKKLAETDKYQGYTADEVLAEINNEVRK